jgi:phage-related protein
MEAMAGGVFSEVVLLVVNTDRLDQPPELEETFQITNSSAKNYIVTFQLGAENPLSIGFPRRRQFKDRCAWQFKGYGCPYVGSLPTCDYTLDGANGCKKHFPGSTALPFKGLPGLVRMNI